MEGCVVCKEEAFYLCVHCTINLCNKHKAKHEKAKNENRFRKIDIFG